MQSHGVCCEALLSADWQVNKKMAGLPEDLNELPADIQNYMRKLAEMDIFISGMESEFNRNIVDSFIQVYIFLGLNS